MVHMYDLALLCWIALIIGSGSSHFHLCGGLSRSYGFLHLCPVDLHLPGFALLFVGRRLPSSVCYIPRLPGAERYSVGPRYLPRLSSTRLHFPALSRNCDWLEFLRTLSAEYNIITFAVQAFSCVWLDTAPSFDAHPTTLHLCSLDRCGPER